jgi:hypothetical protein
MRALLPLLVPSVAGALVALGGCSDPTRYPSLALRPIETMSLAEPVTKPAPAGTVAGAADARYAPLVAQARTGDAAFRRAFDEARPALTRGRDAGIGSDAWTAAQVGLSRMQAARDPVTQALLSLQAESEAPETRGDTGLAAAAARALAAVAAIDRSEAATLAALTPAQS